MQPDTIASAYLRSLVHFPTGHFCTLTQRPLPRLLTLDFELWMDGFEAALDASGFAGPLPTRDEIRWWIDVALARYFEASADAPLAEVSAPAIDPADFAREHRDPPPTRVTVDARDAKKKPGSVTLRRWKLGMAASG
jgi:hypothetical protein